MEISYYKTENIELDRLIEFQGKLKELSPTNAEKLWRNMQESGFAEPFVVWENKKKIYVLGGHQRLKVLKDKRESSQEIPDKYPCNFVKCADKKSAKKLLLALASQFGKVIEQGLFDFMTENEINIDDLRSNVDIPSINIDQFDNSFFHCDTATQISEELDIKEFNTTFILIELQHEKLIEIQELLEEIEKKGCVIDVASN